MATKYELATELRALTRGTKAGPICRMKKHELEAEIDRIKAVRSVAVPEHAPAKPGPLGPREVKVRQVMKDGMALSIPEVPKIRIVKNGDMIRRGAPRTLTFGDEGEDVIKHIEEKQAAALPTPKPHRCTCPLCPQKVASAVKA